jgi:polyphosphate kinase
VDTRLKKETVDRIVEGATLAQATGQHIIILFEGRTAAGKGGAIKCFTEHLNPRGARVVFPALHRIPADPGQTRVLRPQLVQPRRHRTRDGCLLVRRIPEFLRETPGFERMLVRSGIRRYKPWS